MVQLHNKALLFVCYSVALLNGVRTMKTQFAEVCGEDGDCLSGPVDCNNVCGCDRVYYFNETTGQCEINIKHLLHTLREKYNTQEKVQQEAERVFQRVIIAAILFGTCASLCSLSACIYCFHVNHSDMRLKKDVEALAQKLGRTHRMKKPCKTPLKPESQSCNVVVEDAGVFVC